MLTKHAWRALKDGRLEAFNVDLEEGNLSDGVFCDVCVQRHALHVDNARARTRGDAVGSPAEWMRTERDLAIAVGYCAWQGANVGCDVQCDVGLERMKGGGRRLERMDRALRKPLGQDKADDSEIRADIDDRPFPYWIG